MAVSTSLAAIHRPHLLPRATHEAVWVRWLLTGIALLFVGFFLVLPLATWSFTRPQACMKASASEMRS